MAPKAPPKKAALSTPAPPKKANLPRRGVNQESLIPEIGIKRVAFIRAARALDNALKEAYGDSMTITKFEKILNEVRGRQDLKDRVYLTDELLRLHHAYNHANGERQEELVAFRQTLQLTPVASTVSVQRVDDLFASSL